MNALPRPIALISLILQGALALQLLNILVLASLTGLEMGLIRFDANGHPTPDWLWDLSNDSQVWTGWSSTILFFLTGIIFLRWIYLASHNSFAIRREFRTDPFTSPLQRSQYVTPGWSVGFYFIPIANLWKPYSAMKQINAATAKLTGISAAKFLPFWWFLWITDGAFNSILADMWERAETNEEMFGVDAWYATSYFLSALLNVFALILVRRITHAQYSALTQQVFPDSLPESDQLPAQ